METIGISYWGGPMTRTTEICLEHNKSYFDRFYLITDQVSYKEVHDGIICLPSHQFKNWVVDKFKYQLKPNFLSDILTYFGINILEEVYGIHENKILNLDTDYYIYNKLLILDLFRDNTKAISIRDEAEKLCHGDKLYWNCGALMTVRGDHSFEDMVDDYLRRHISEDMWYTEIGPRLVNTSNIASYFDRNPYSCIKPHTLDKGILSGGLNVIPKVHHALGCHLTDSNLKSIGYTIKNIKEEGTNLLIYIE